MGNPTYIRPLKDLDTIDSFLKNVLQYNCDNKTLSALKIGEMEMSSYDNRSSTLINTKFRDRKYVSEDDRWNLRSKIVQELASKPRINDDDKIKLGHGGVLPNTGVKNEKQAYLIIGLPASGKSSVASEIADYTNSIILDSDYAKRKLPEYSDSAGGASLVHLESDMIIFGSTAVDIPQNFQTLSDICFSTFQNVVIPKIGHDYKSTLKLAESLKALKYDVNLILISLDRRDATIRALKRFETTGRYVPLSLIFDGYGNDPILTYYRLKNFNYTLFNSFGKLSTDVPKGERPKIIDASDTSPVKIY